MRKDWYPVVAAAADNRYSPARRVRRLRSEKIRLKWKKSLFRKIQITIKKSTSPDVRWTLKNKKMRNFKFFCINNIFCCCKYSTVCSVSDQVFSGSGSDFFSWVRIRIGQKPRSDPENPESGPQKKRQQTEVQKNSAYVALSALSFWVSLPQKPNQKPNLDPISLLMDGSGL